MFSNNQIKRETMQSRTKKRAFGIIAVAAFAVVAISIAVILGIPTTQPETPTSEKTAAKVEFPVDESLPQGSVARLSLDSEENAEGVKQANAEVLEDPNGGSYYSHQIMMSVDSATTQQELEESLQAQGIQVESLALISNDFFDGQTTLLVEYSSDQDPLQLRDSLIDAGIATNTALNSVVTICGEAESEDIPQSSSADATETATADNAATQAAEETSEPQASASSVEMQPLATVNDPLVSREWYLDAIDAPSAWDIVKCSGTVTVAVLDTGVDYDHPDIVANLNTEYAYSTLTLSSGGEAVEDGHGHGTNVCGVIAATANNGVGYAGVSYNAQVLPIKCLDDSGNGSTASVLAAINYATQLKKNGYVSSLRVINMSLGNDEGEGEGYFDAAINKAYNAGILVVAAAGNEATSTPCYPASCDHVISVSALKSSSSGPGIFDSSYSNYGSTVDLSAPGTAVFSIYKDGKTNVSMSGTSQATPMVSAVAALVYACNMDATPDYVESMLESTATDLGSTGRDDYYGYGAINAAAAVQAASEIIPATNCTMSSIPAQTYVAGGVCPKPSISYDNTLLVEGADYDLSYSNNTQVGTAQVTATLKNHYRGTITRSFTIVAAKVTPPTASNYTYDGKSHTGLSSTSNSYYYVTGNVSATDVGAYTSTAILRDKTNYVWATTNTSANLTFTWSITPGTYDLSGITFSSQTVTYDGNAHYLQVEGDLPSGLTVSYTNNGKTAAGTYTVTANFHNSVSGMTTPSPMTATLYIKRANVSSCQITWPESTTTLNTKETPSVTVAHNGRTLIQGTDYTVSTSSTSAGERDITVTGCGNYQSSTSNKQMVLFPDVQDPDAWYYDAVYEANANGFITGYGTGYFGPADTLTRGQAAVILYRYYGGSASKYNRTGMPDVEDDAYYTAAANWAVENGVINGKDNGSRFAPNDPLTREQLCTIIYNAAKQLGGVNTSIASTKRFNAMADGDSVSNWARFAVMWSLDNDVIKGKQVSGSSARYIAPQDAVTRAEMAAIIMNVHDGGVLTASSADLAASSAEEPSRLISR